MRWFYGESTSVTAELDAGISIWRVIGDVTIDILPAMMVDAFAWHEAARALAHVADYRSAAMMVPLRVFQRIVDRFIRPGVAIGAPMVIVPSASQALFFRRYAARMSAKGVGRVVCLDFCQALLWAAETATYRLREGWAPSELGSSASIAIRGAQQEQPRAAHSAASPRQVFH